MRRDPILAITALLTLVVSAAHAQTLADSLTVTQTAVACASPPTLSSGTPLDALRVIGAQDTVLRSLFGPRDLLIINGGTAKGVQLGQQYFVRRRIGFGISYGDRSPHAVRTAGRIRIVAANDTTAIAIVDHSCDGIVSGDYLEPFIAPPVPPGTDRTDTSGALDFSSLGRVLFGDEERNTGGTDDYMLIDRGADQSIVPGVRFAIYRDLGVAGLPLASIGEATVVATAPTMALVRINLARDAVRSGDLVVPRKP